ncbi:MAG: alkaline phosphatase family protein [Pyrinomonadaceae bacterium]
MKFSPRSVLASSVTFLFLIASFACVSAQGVKRVVMIKIDGLPGYYVDHFVRQRDPAAGRSILPWIEEVFYKNGTRVPYFYARGMSLSGPSWSQLDTGQHLQIKGNVEYDRLTLHAYDYLNFFPYYVQYGMNKKEDMPAVEVLDQMGIPLFYDMFPYDKRYVSHQLYQRSNEWEVLAGGFVNLYPGNARDFLDEWTMGLDLRRLTINQAERDIIGKVGKRAAIDYYDYYDASFDHLSHNNSDDASRLVGLKELDLTIGRIWTAIQASDRAGETALILVSDHGFNSVEKVYSQGFNLVKLLASRAGGGHHVITKRRTMLDYSIKGVYPLVPLITTTSDESYYLKGESSVYPTALLDFDGNERSSIHLRDSDLNVLQILLQQLQRGKLSSAIKIAVAKAFFDVIDRCRPEWQKLHDQLTQELEALHRSIEGRQKLLAAQPTKFSPEELARGKNKEVRRLAALIGIDVDAEAGYRKYSATLARLLSLKRDSFDARRIKAEEIIAAGAMGSSNSIYKMQNYVVGLSIPGLTLDAAGNLDMDKSFSRVDYFDLLQAQRVRNNVQAAVSNRPVDFTAVRVPLESVADALSDEMSPNEDPIWLHGDDERQALILARVEVNGSRTFRFLPVSHLRQGSDGRVTFDIRDWSAGFPLKYFEDPNFAISVAGRKAWLKEWHSEKEWLEAIHLTQYSNGLIGLNEQLGRHPIYDREDGGITDDARTMRQFRQRQRRLAEADLLILARDHWNFDVKGFNPGGNHGSFFRVSTNATLMIAGGAATGIPRGLSVEEPYDSLSFIPTVMRLMGKIDGDNRPVPELRERGFRRFPGRVINEITSPAQSGHSTK